MTKIDFTMTAMQRPELVGRTLASFAKHLKGINLAEQTIHLNIDPLPDDRRPAQTILAVSKFFKRIEIYLPEHASFPAALKWCWSQPKTSFFFHLEDDWELMEDYWIEHALLQLNSRPALSCVNLRAYDFGDGDSRICLSPGVHRTAHARAMASLLSLTANPEKQLRPACRDNPEGGKHIGFLGMQTPGNRIIKDIGREWLDTSGWRKTKPIYFTTWERA